MTRVDQPAELQGVLPVLQLPLADDETIDFDGLRREVDWLFARGVQGVATGMVTETLRLSTEERRRVAAAVCSATAERGPTVVSVGAESAFVASELARHAESVGATAVMAAPPQCTASSGDELRRYFESLASAVSIPLVVQDASGYVGRPIETRVMAELLDAIGRDRVYFKPEAAPLGPQQSALADATGGAARIFDGSGGAALVDSYRRGVVGAMPGSELVEGIVALWRALEAGDEDAIYRVSLPLSAIVALQTGLDGYLAIEKYLLVKQGVFRSATIRGPVAYKLDEPTRREVDRLYERLCVAVSDHQSPTLPSS